MAEYFQDYDQLRSGCVSVSQFRRALSSMGMSALGKHNLSNSQFEMLAQVYRNPKQPDNIYWTQFLADIESGEWMMTRSSACSGTEVKI